MSGDDRTTFEKIASRVAAGAGITSPKFAWYDDPVDAYQQAILTALDSEMRAAFDENGELEIDFDTFEESIQALRSGVAKHRPGNDFREGVTGIFNLGGLYARATSAELLTDRIWFDHLVGQEAPSPRLGDSKAELAFEKNCACLDRHVETVAKGRIRERALGLTNDPSDFDLCETIGDGLAETARRVGFLGPCRLRRAHPPVAGETWWAFSYGNAIWATGGPSSVLCDEDGYIHSSDGPAASFAPGSRLFAWHGQLVPEGWIVGHLHPGFPEDIKRLNLGFDEIGYLDSIRVASEIISERQGSTPV